MVDYTMSNPMDAFFKTAGGLQQLQSNQQNMQQQQKDNQYLNQQRESQQQAQQRMASAQQKAVEAINSGMPAQELAVFSMQNPEIGEILRKNLGLVAADKEQKYIQTTQAILANPNDVENILKDGFDMIPNSGDEYISAKALAKYREDPKSFLDGIEKTYSMLSPDGYKSYLSTQPKAEAPMTEYQRQSLQINRDRLGLDKTKAEAASLEAQSKLEDLKMAAPKLSVNMEKALDSSVALAVESRNSAASMSELASRWREEKPSVGVFGSAKSVWDKMTGSDTALRDLRIRQNQIANSQALKFLPPGPATDKDVSLAREGVPTNMDNPELIARWLEGQSRNELRNAAFNDFRAEWLSANGNPGQSKTDTQVNGLDVKKGESFNTAAKRFMAQNEAAVKAGSLRSAPETSKGSDNTQNFNYLWGG